MKNVDIYLFLAMIICFSVVFSDTVYTYINFSCSIDSIPYTYRSGMFIGGGIRGICRPWCMEFIPMWDVVNKHVPGCFRFTLSLAMLKNPAATPTDSFRLPDPSDPELDSVVLKMIRGYDSIFIALSARGGKPYIDITGVPRWLSKNYMDTSHFGGWDDPFSVGYLSVANLSPPRGDSGYAVWSSIVETIVDHFNNDLGLDVFYTCWNEPDWDFFYGTADEYFELYKATVLGARRADPNAKVGGIGSSSLLKRKYWLGIPYTSEPMQKAFIRYCATTPLTELGYSRLPIDFVDFHFGGYKYEFYADSVRTWLSSYGYSADIPIVVGEWQVLCDGPAVGDVTNTDGPQCAAQIVAIKKQMASARIDYPCYTHLIDENDRDTSNFWAHCGIVSWHWIHKPSWWAHYLLSSIGSRIFRVRNTDSFLVVIAGANADTFNVLLSNVAGTTFTAAKIKNVLINMGYNRDSLIRLGLTIDTIQALIRGELSLDSLHLPDADKESLSVALRIGAIGLSRTADSCIVTISVSGMTPGMYSVKTFIVDGSHSNWLNCKDSAESAIESAKNEAIDSARYVFRDSLFSKGYTLHDDSIFVYLFNRYRCYIGNFTIMRDSIFEWIDSHPDVFSKPADSVKSDMPVLFSFFIDEFNLVWSSRINEVNSWRCINLFKFADSTMFINNSGLEINQSLAPNAIVEIKFIKVGSVVETEHKHLNHDLFYVFPNPFNSTLSIYSRNNLDIKIFDITGKLVYSYHTIGKDEIIWKPDDRIPIGIYFVKATYGNKTEVRKILYLR